MKLSLTVAEGMVPDPSRRHSASAIAGAYVLLALGGRTDEHLDDDQNEARELGIVEGEPEQRGEWHEDVSVPLETLSGLLGRSVKAALKLLYKTLDIDMGNHAHRKYGFRAVAPRFRIEEETQSAIVAVERAFAGMAHPNHDPAGEGIEFDPAAMVKFRSRYAPTLYLRCLSWLRTSGFPETWRVERSEDAIILDLPATTKEGLADIQLALGIMGVIQPTRILDRLAGVEKDLATAGIGFGLEIVKTATGQLDAVRIRIEHVEPRAKPKTRRPRRRAVMKARTGLAALYDPREDLPLITPKTPYKVSKSGRSRKPRRVRLRIQAA